MSGFNFGGTPSTTTTAGGLFGSGSTSTPGFSFGSPAPSAAPTGQATPFAFGTGTPASTGTTPGFSLPNTGATPAATGATPAATGGTPAAAGGFSFAKPGGTPGFTGFGAQAGTTPAAISATAGFSLGATKTTASGLTLNASQTQASSGGFALGSTPGPGSLAGLLGQPNTTPQSGSTPFLTSLSAASSSSAGTTSTPALGGTTLGSSLLSLKTPANAAVTPGIGLTLTGGGLKLGQTTATTQATTQTTTGVAPTLGFGTAATSVATSTSAAPTLGFGMTATTSTPAVGFGLSTASTSSTASLGFGLSTASTKASTTTTTTGAVASQKMNYKQLEEQINKWMTDLEEQERQFLLQATQVNAWDRLLVDNGEKITQLNNDKERVKVDQNKLEQELDFIKAQQRELEELLTPMEKSLEQLPSASFQQHADLERENTYQLAYNVDAQLKRMVQDLKEIIDHLNSSNSTQDTNDPILQITMILNAHMDSLQWIDTNTALLSRRVEDISKQMESQRKDQERNFRLVYD